MQFDAPADRYDRFMGRYSASLAPPFAAAARVASGLRVCDVGCGPGALTGELAARVGSGNVAAIDPTPHFVAVCRGRVPGADVREGVAEELPWAAGEFDVTLSALVLGFLTDPDLGVREMARVTRPGGTVAACMWDIATGGMTMLRVFWDAVRRVDPAAVGESAMAGTADGDIADRFRRAGLADVESGALTAHVQYTDFDDFWEPFTYAVGPAGGFLGSLTPTQRDAVQEFCRAEIGDGPVTLPARAWYATGRVTAR